METNYQYIEALADARIGRIVLNRPKVLNAINRKMVSEIISALEEFERNNDIRVIVITGKGRAFAAGADIDEMADDTAISMELLNQFADWDRIYKIKKPIIGSVHGYVLGGGFELALACDMLIAAEGTKFGFPEVNLGVMPGAGGTQLLSKLIGKTKALEWLWTGDMHDAKEAFRLGIVNKVVPAPLLMEETNKFADKLAEKAPLSLRLIKEAAYKAQDVSLHEGMQFERKNFYLLFSSEDQKEGMQAFIEKRKANFKGK